MEKLERQQALLEAIVQEYIKTAKPVGSKTLATEYGFDYSPATIRNDMAALERVGFIAQPHTSAGRIPTEKGYQYYIQNFLEKKQLDKQKQVAIDTAMQQREIEQRRAKEMAKAISQLSGEAVIVSLGEGEYYYTGISQLFHKPEFHEHAALMATVSGLFDELDSIMTGTRRQQQGVEVLVGHDNPFSDMMSMVLGEYTHNNQQTMMGILGPMRMDYDTNIAILEYIEEVINNDV